MAISPAGHIYVGSQRLGKVHVVIDKNHDYKADDVKVVDSGLFLPSGVAFQGGHLYVGAVNSILRYRDIDKYLDNPAKPEVVTDALPDKTHHGWKFISFGPDGLLYVPVGAPCNVCLSENPWFASILRMDVRTKKPVPEIYASGIRNTVGFDWHPKTAELWFTDNGRDLMGDDSPPGELNRVSREGQHFGYPFFHGKSIPDPEFGNKGKTSAQYVEPELELDPHVAPLGMMFYTGDMFPAEYRNQIFVPEHGSWNRSAEAGHTGYRVTLGMKKGNSLSYEVFIDGWLGDDNKSWGRPVHLLQLPDGSVLLSDDKADLIYRITYKNTGFKP